MSGFECAGLALAVLPVLMSAAQQYNNCLGPFSRYKRFAKEARDYYQELEIQRTIYRNQCRNLLEEIVDHDAASSMLNSLSQQSWANKKLDEQLTQQLGESLDACVAVIELIEQRLDEIINESQCFKSIVEQEKETTPKSIRNKLWKRNVGEKLRLSFSKSRLDENITKLRSHNDDLRTLSLQTRRAIPVAKRAVSCSSRTARSDIRKYQTIGKASYQVYEALRKACTKHTEHMAHFRMEVENIILHKEASPQVKFNMAFTHRALNGNPGSGDPIWFLVDSIINEHVDTCSNNQIECLYQLENSLKRQLEPVLTPVAKKPRKSVRFAPSVPAPIPIPCLPLSPPILVVDNCKGQDFCDHLRRRFRQPLQANACVVLENTAQCKQMVYPSAFTASSEMRKATSLGQLITSSSTPGIVGRILLHERIALAKMLAIAVLQYHATPWLQLSWRSDDILFFDIEGNMQIQSSPNLSAPYINAKIQGQITHVPAQPQSAMARNPVLFSLGVVLLEIAHGASLESLKLPCDADNGHLHREFFTARRLAKTKRTVMGAIYNDIVEQLVESAFPSGDDLNDPGMQARFYEDVICPLDDLEQGFRKLCMGGS